MRSKFFVFKTLEIQYNKVSTGKSSINKTCKKPAGLRCKRHARYFDGAATALKELDFYIRIYPPFMP